ncbi:MAG: RNA methyltransferase [Lentisphaerales bacterium]|nr:MAG: RNA methyltransferase [Lentisphaerales bacterium]
MSLDNIRVVLVSTIYGGNVGSVCRAMANCGLSDLALVAPCELNMEDARKMACSASAILEGRRAFPTLTEAVADCGLVVGATARLGLYRSHSQTPRELAPRIVETAEDHKVALVFGPEDNGLSNKDLALCGQLVQIPTAPEYTSLNLAQAVMICCHEIYVATGRFEPSMEKSEEASSAHREKMFEMWRELLLKIGFMKEDKADHMMLGLRRILSRGNLSEDDARIMMGIARQTMWATDNVSEGENCRSASGAGQ